MKSLTGINSLHGLVVYLYTKAQAASRIDVLGRQDTNGNTSIFCQVDVVFKHRTIAIGIFFHHVFSTHATVTTTKIPQNRPSMKAGIYVSRRIVVINGRDGIFL